MQIHEKIEQARVLAGLTQDEMAKKLGIQRSTYQYWEKATPSLDKIRKVAAALGLTVDHFLSDNDESFVSRETYREQLQEQKMTIKTYLVPLVPIKVQAGYIESYMLDEFIEKLERFPMAPGINPRGAEWRWFEVQGESMEPTLFEGDYILCSSVNQEDWGSLENYYMYVIVTGGENRGMWVKRIKRRGSLQITLYSDNKKVKPRLIELSEVREVWKVRRHLNARMPPPEKIED